MEVVGGGETRTLFPLDSIEEDDEVELLLRRSELFVEKPDDIIRGFLALRHGVSAVRARSCRERECIATHLLPIARRSVVPSEFCAVLINP